MAIPDSTRRLGQSGEELVVADAARLVQHRLGGGPGQGDRQPVDRLAARRCAASQSAMADRLFTMSPIPARTKRGGARPDQVQVHQHRDRRGDPVRASPDSLPERC